MSTTAEADAAYYLRVLHDLIDRGADLARRVHEAAMAATPTADNRPDSDPTVAFDRIARTVRRTIALARHIAEHPAHAEKPAARTAARARVIRGVEDAIHRRRNDTDAQSLHAEFAERLDDPEFEHDLDGRSIDDVIEEICRDLGVAAQGRAYSWKRRTPKDIAALRARAAQPPGAHAAGLHLIQGGRPKAKPS